MTEANDENRSDLPEFHAEAALGRYAYENSRLRRGEKKFYEKLRRLENSVRRHATGQCECTSAQECLMKIYRNVPAHPRKVAVKR